MRPMSRKDVLLESLHKFYAESDHLAQFTLYTSKKNACISLRLLDWLVTNYSKKRNVVLNSSDGKTFNMFVEYKAQLKAYSKKFFDPFCRRDRITVTNSNGESQETTVGQMNFLRWCMRTGVIQYAIQNREAIEADMLCVSKLRESKPSADGKRQELSVAAIKACTKTFCHVTVKF